MSYTDQEIRSFTQIAYADLAKGYDYLSTVFPEKKSFSINEVVTATKMVDPNANLDSLSCLSDKQMSEWKISGVYDTNEDTGFYACIIETEPGTAAVGFRGSESLSEVSNIKNDWIKADLGLLNSTVTTQHIETEKFLKQFQDELRDYDSLTMTGHSLGGNLAEYSTIVSKKYGLQDNISECVSLDGPGFSDEFIKLHYLDIKEVSDKMTHYRWSLVGTLLNDLPGVQYEYVSVSNKGEDKMNPLSRHNTKYLNYDKDGKFIKGKQDFLSICTSSFSKTMEKILPSFVNVMTIDILSGIFIVPCEFFLGKNGIITKLKNTLVDYLDDNVFSKLDEFIRNYIDSHKTYFKVNTNRLASDVSNTMDCYNNIIANVNSMFEEVQRLNEMWTGPANLAFTANFKKEHTDIINYLSGIKNFLDLLNRDSKEYNSCENYNINLIDTINI